MCPIKIFLEKQASRQQFEITCSLGWLVGWFLFPFLFKLMKAEREGGRGGGVQRKYLCLLCIHIKIVEHSIDRYSSSSSSSSSSSCSRPLAEGETYCKR